MNEILNNNGYGYVDLGLPSKTLWATCNIGADKPSDFGLYFQWGEVNGKNPNAYYFINPNGIIVNNYYIGSEAFSYVKEFYKEIQLPRWKPKYDENYYYFTDMQGIMVGKWKNNPSDSWRYDFGNYFKSYEEAKTAKNKIKEVLNKEI